MVKKCYQLLSAVAVVLVLSAITGYSVESVTQKCSGKLRQVPLIIGRAPLAGILSVEDDHEQATERLDIATEYIADDGVAACLIGVKLAGWATGYEFMPVHILKVGEKPRDVLVNMQSESEVFVLALVNTGTTDFGSAQVIMVMGYAALYHSKTMSPITSSDISGMKKIDPKQIKGDEVDGEYWIKTVASRCAQKFDQKFLAKMQAALDGKRIIEELTALQAFAVGTIAPPTIEILLGGDKREPELKISTAKAGLTANVYLVSNDGNLCRKWFVGGASELDVVLVPGTYNLYMKTIQEEEVSSHRVSHGQIKVEYKKRYTFNIQ